MKDDIKKAFQTMQERFDNELLGDLTALYLFELGEECGQWTVNFEAGKGKITKGVEGEANCTVIVSAEDFLKILSKEANSQMMFMTGKLKVKGNMGLAMKLQKILG